MIYDDAKIAVADRISVSQKEPKFSLFEENSLSLPL